MKYILLFLIIPNLLLSSELLFNVEALQFYNGSNKPQLKYPLILSNGKEYYIRNDNPLVHGATSFLTTASYIKGGFKADLGMIAEHRGFSYGVYNKAFINIFPRYKFSFGDTLKIFGQELIGRASSGFDRSYTAYKGLTIQELDIQGTTIEIRYKDLKVQYRKIGDLFQGIGYGINDLDDFTFTYDGLSIFGSDKLELQYGFIAGAGYQLYGHSNFTNYTVDYQFLDQSIYGQFSSRNRYEGDEIKGNAYLFGIKGKSSFFESKLKLDYKIEHRNYSSNFNEGFYTNDYGLFEGYNNLENVYPIHYNLRKMSSWGTYSEFQGSDVRSINFLLDLEYNFYKNISFYVNLDYIYLDVVNVQSQRSNNYLYDLSKIGFKYYPIENFNILISYANYEMELRKLYPTYSLLNAHVLRIESKFSFKHGLEL